MKNNAPSLPVPTESVEQQCLFRWAAFQSGRFPELALLYHVPNGGSRQKGSKTSDDQKAWLSNLENQGYFVALCKGWEAAAKVITEYLTMGGEEG